MAWHWNDNDSPLTAGCTISSPTFTSTIGSPRQSGEELSADIDEIAVIIFRRIFQFFSPLPMQVIPVLRVGVDFSNPASPAILSNDCNQLIFGDALD